MSQAYECPTLAGDDTANRYVAGTLSPEEADHFQVHLAECERCRARVHECAALAHRSRGRSGRFSWRHLLWLAPLAAVIAAVLLLRPFNRVRRLSEVRAVPDLSEGRAPPVPAGRAGPADAGFDAYRRADWDAAARLLTAAGGAEPGAGSTLAFYLGVARLMGGDPLAAMLPLSLAGRGPFAAEASYYRAKAFLRLGRADSALLSLRAAARDSTVGPRARALADSVRAAIDR